MNKYNKYIKSLLPDVIFNFFTKGHSRTVKAKKNVLLSFFIKGISIIIGFLMVPLCLDYLDQTHYGIWLTMSSFLGWFTFFEVGLGAGLRNKLAESLALKDYEKGQIYVSTTYAILAFISLFLMLIFTIINPFIDWTKILNTQSNLASDLNIIALIVFNFFFLRFVLKLISIILYADQKPAFANTVGPTGNLVSIIIIYALTKTTKGSLFYLATTLSAVPVVIMVIFSIILYSKKYRMIAPSLKKVKFKYARNLFSLGVKFFIIQISALVMFQTSNIVIAQFFGPAQVTPYNIAYKLFSTISMIFTIVMTPFWSAFTEAWTLKDVDWIKKSIQRLIKFWGLIVSGGIIVLIFSPMIYRLWIGDKVSIPFFLSAMLLIYFSIFTFGGIFNMFINGVGKIKLQMISLLIGALLFFPIAFILIKYLHFGPEALVIAMIISNIYSPIIAPMQYYKLINNKATGIWGK